VAHVPSVGCGKTSLARAISKSFEGEFIPISGPELFSKWVGESEAQLREKFDQAVAAAEVTNKPSVIFFDEFDSLTGNRDDSDSNIELRFVSQLLVLLDGLDKSKQHLVYIIAATNRLESIDSAVKRTGRFDLYLEVPKPNDHARREIIESITSRFSPPIDPNDPTLLDFLHSSTSGFSPSDVETLFKNASLICLARCVALVDNSFEQRKEEQRVLKRDDFIRAFDLHGSTRNQQLLFN
jgi:transitional endoplasmic reticulum ATPase